MTRPAFKKLAAAAAALTAAGTALAAFSSMTPTARGLLESGPLPLASRTEIAQLTTSVGSIQSQLARQAAEDSQRDKLLALTRQSQIETMLSTARADAARAPSAAARAYVCDLILKVDELRRQNGLPLIPPCQ